MMILTPVRALHTSNMFARILTYSSQTGVIITVTVPLVAFGMLMAGMKNTASGVMAGAGIIVVLFSLYFSNLVPIVIT